MQSLQTKSSDNSYTSRIVWLDVMRFIAILLVIACHCTDPLNASPEVRSNPDINFWGSAYGSILRPCVPLFVMMTGLLLLPVRQESSVFYRKRIPRVLFPFLIWSVLFNLAPWFIQLVGGSQELVVQFFPWEPEPSASLVDGLKDVLMIPLHFTVFATPMWYVYTLIGLYLYMPIFSAWVEKASDRAKLNFLIVWGISLFIPYLMVFFSKYLFGTCSWNSFGLFYYFAGFNGYLLLGHYLGRMDKPSLGKVVSVGIPVFVVGYIVTFVGFRYMTSDPNVTEEGMELFFTYCSPNVVMMTIPLFMIVRYVNVRSEFLCRALENLTKCGFGIYCAHYFFIGPCFMFTKWIGTPLPFIVPVSAVFTFICTWALVYILSKLPKSKYIIG